MQSVTVFFFAAYVSFALNAHVAASLGTRLHGFSLTMSLHLPVNDRRKYGQKGKDDFG